MSSTNKYMARLERLVRDKHYVGLYITDEEKRFHNIDYWCKCHITDFFILADGAAKYASVFVRNKPYQSTIIFVGKAVSCLYARTLDQTKKARRAKHSSLFLSYCQWRRKKFITLTSLLLMVWQSKLECLSLSTKIRITLRWCLMKNNVRLVWKGSLRTNTLAYFAAPSIMKKNSL